MPLSAYPSLPVFWSQPSEISPYRIPLIRPPPHDRFAAQSYQPSFSATQAQAKPAAKAAPKPALGSGSVSLSTKPAPAKAAAPAAKKTEPKKAAPSGGDAPAAKKEEPKKAEPKKASKKVAKKEPEVEEVDTGSGVSEEEMAKLNKMEYVLALGFFSRPGFLPLVSS